MTKEEKELLLIDLCARLPYGVKLVQHKANGQIAFGTPICIDTRMFAVELDNSATLMVSLDTLKPYLRPMSSMTEEEEKMIDEIYGDNSSTQSDIQLSSKLINFLNAHHFDHHGLIEKGLALEAPEGMYDFK